jgi:TolB protein
VAIDGISPTLVSSHLEVQSFSPPTWSPDGTRLAFIGTPPGGPDGVWMVAPDGSGLTRLPIEATSFASVSWSPDGNYLVIDVPLFDANFQFSGPSNVYIIRADGSGLQEITSGDRFDVHPAWGP